MMHWLKLLLVTAIYAPLMWRCVAAIRHNRAAENWDDIQKSPLLRQIYRHSNREKYRREEKPVAWFGLGLLVPAWCFLAWFVVVSPMS